MIAVSRRSSKLFPLQAARSARRSSPDSTGTGSTGTVGRFIRSIGERSISPSSTRNLKNCWRARKRLEAVAGLVRALSSSMNASTCSRRIDATFNGMP